MKSQDVKNPNLLAAELEALLKAFYEGSVIPQAKADGLDPVKLFDAAIAQAAKLAKPRG